jgi:hypothetical protein
MLLIELFSQHPLLDFTGRRSGDGIGEDHFFGDLELANLFLALFDELFSSQLLTFDYHQDGLDRLTPCFMGVTDDSRIGRFGVVQKRILDFLPAKAPENVLDQICFITFMGFSIRTPRIT